MIIPNYFVSSIADIDFNLYKVYEHFINRLKENGYKNVLLDKDNAATITHKMEIPESILPNLEEGKNVFGFEHFMIFSNSIGSKQEDRQYKKANIFERKWNIKVAHHECKKPSGYSEIIQKDDFDKSIMIGDSLTTDIYGGNENGLLTVLVLPLSKSNKSFYNSCKLSKYDLFSYYGVMGMIYYYLMYNYRYNISRKKMNYKPKLINQKLDVCFKNKITIE